MARDHGKEFENMTRAALIKEGACWERLPDQMTGRAGSQNPCDFIAFVRPNLFYIECKSCQEDSMDIKSYISEHQWISLLDRSAFKGVYAGYLIWFVGADIHWISAKALEKHYKKKKSITNDELDKLGIAIPHVIGRNSIEMLDLTVTIKKGRKK